jgi:hypothetical protein
VAADEALTIRFADDELTVTADQQPNPRPDL